MGKAAVKTKSVEIPGLGPVQWRAGEHARIVVPMRASRVAATSTDRVIHVIGSTQRIDRYRTKLVGWKLTEFRKNPIFLWQHMSWDAPLGRAIRVGVDGDDNLAFDIEFIPADLLPFAETALQLVLGKWMRACSVGFQPRTCERIEEGDDAGVYILKDNDLLELSLVSVPANPDALVKLGAVVPEAHRGLLVVNQRLTEVDGLTLEAARKRFTEWAHDAPIPELPDDPTHGADGSELCSLVQWTKDSAAEKGARYVMLAAGEFGADGGGAAVAPAVLVAAADPAATPATVPATPAKGPSAGPGTGTHTPDARDGGRPSPVAASAAAPDGGAVVRDGNIADTVLAMAWIRAALAVGVPLDIALLDPTAGLDDVATAIEAAFHAHAEAEIERLVESRAGAVLNRANKERLRQIAQLAQSVLESAGEKDDDDDAGADGKAAAGQARDSAAAASAPADGDAAKGDAAAATTGDPAAVAAPASDGGSGDDVIENAIARLERGLTGKIDAKLAGLNDRVASIVERVSAFEAKHLGRALVDGKRETRQATRYDKLMSAADRLDAVVSGDKRNAAAPAADRSRSTPRASQRGNRK